MGAGMVVSTLTIAGSFGQRRPPSAPKNDDGANNVYQV